MWYMYSADIIHSNSRMSNGHNPWNLHTFCHKEKCFLEVTSLNILGDHVLYCIYCNSCLWFRHRYDTSKPLSYPELSFCRSIAWLLACCVALPEHTSIIRTPEVTIAISSERPKEAALKVCALFSARIEVCDRTIFDVFNFWCVFVGSIRLQ